MTPETLAKLRLYVVTDRNATNGRDLVDVVEAALAGGARAIQLRERGLETRELFALAVRLREVTARHGALLLVNDRVDLALACGADGVHLPGRSFRPADARALLGPDRLIGMSTHSPREVEEAAADGADFAVLGPIYDTPSKRAFGSPIGIEALRRASAADALPLIAIGGIDETSAGECIRSGAAGIAVIRAILGAADPGAAARRLLSAPDTHRGVS